MKDARHSLRTGSGREPMIFRGFDFAFARRSFRSLFRTGAAASAVLLLAVGARAGTIDFGTGLPVGKLGPSETIGGIVIDGFWFDGGVWSSPAGLDLFRRDETNDHGLGVCNPDETCDSTTGEGNINELDNAGNPELIRLTLPAGYRWVSVQVSSLDDNSADTDSNDDLVERGQVFASDAADPGTGIGGTPFEQFKGGAALPIEPVIPVPIADQFAHYIYFEPIDWENAGLNDNNDFLVWQATIERRKTPEPGTLGLLAAGLLGLALASRRRAKN